MSRNLDRSATIDDSLEGIEGMKDAAAEVIKQVNENMARGIRGMKLSEYTAELEAEDEAALEEQVRHEKSAVLAQLQAEQEAHLQELAEEYLVSKVAAKEREEVVELPVDPQVQVTYDDIVLPPTEAELEADETPRSTQHRSRQQHGTEP